MIVRRIVFAVTLVLSSALGGAGCTVIQPPIEPPTSAPATSDPAARQALAHALAALSTTSYRVRVTEAHGRVVATGRVLPAAGAFDARCATTVEGDVFAESVRKIGRAVWLNVAYPSINGELGITPTQWISASPSSLTAGAGARFDVGGHDPFDLAGLLAGVAVVRGGATDLHGIVDYTRSRGVSAPDADELSEAGTAASATPFDATLDSHGRLVTVTIDADGYNQDLTRAIALSSYGTAPAPTRPAKAAVVPATKMVYELFNNG